MPSTIPAAETVSAARPFPCDQRAADDHNPAAASSIEAARQVGPERPSHYAAGQAS